jgi:hypothetical protein
MSRWLACAVAVAAVVLAGCGTRSGPGPMPGHSASGRPAAGRVTGRLLLEGGPIRLGGRQPGPRPIRGVLTFTTAGHRAVRARAGRTGVFWVRLPPGRYRVSARSPAVLTLSNGAAVTDSGQLLSGTEWARPCSFPLSVTVTVRRTTRVAVICPVP